MRRMIFALLVLWMAFALAPVAAQQGVTYYVNVRAAKVRAEPKAAAKLITTLGRGKSVVVLEVVEGEKVSNVTTWYKVNVGGKDGYILSSLLTNQAPVVATPKPNNNNATSSNNSQAANPTSAPVSVIPPAAASGVSCGAARVCGQMTSCAQAYACLQAGNTKLDRDKDGVPCETICPGG